MKQPTILQRLSTSMGQLWTIHEHTCADQTEMHEYVAALNLGKDEPEYKVVDLDPNPFRDIFGTNSPIDITEMEQGLVAKEQHLASIDAIALFKRVLAHDDKPEVLRALINDYIRKYS